MCKIGFTLPFKISVLQNPKIIGYTIFFYDIKREKMVKSTTKNIKKLQFKIKKYQNNKQ